MKNQNKKSNENKLKIKKSTVKHESFDSFLENTYLFLKNKITNILDRYKHVIGFILIAFSIYIVIALLEGFYLGHFGKTTQKISFVLSIISILSSIYIGIRHEKAQIQYNVNDFYDFTNGHVIILEMFSSNDVSCIVKLKKIELLTDKYEIIETKKCSDINTLFIHNYFLESHIINNQDICKFTILDEKSYNLGNAVFNCGMNNHESLKLTFKRSDGKNDIKVLIQF